MKKFLIYIILIFLGVASIETKAQNQPVSTKKERNLIESGNKLYDEGNYKGALQKYEEALKENPASVVGLYNTGLSQIRLGTNPSDTTQKAKDMLKAGCQAMERVSKFGKTRPELASRANYNLGNVAFGEDDFAKAINYYKEALRLNPDDENARRNLRIAQLKQQNQDNQDNQNQDQQEQEDQKDQDQQQDQQDQQQDQQDNNQNQQQDQQNQEQPRQQEISPQTAEQILNAMENKENQTRARVANEQGEKSRGRNRTPYNW